MAVFFFVCNGSRAALTRSADGEDHLYRVEEEEHD